MRLQEVDRFFKKNKRRRGLLICFLFAFLWLLVITVTLAPCISCSEDTRIDANPSNGDEKNFQASHYVVPRPKNSRNINGLSNFRLAKEASSTRHQRYLNKASYGSSSVKLKIDGTQGHHLRIRRHAAYKLSERHRRDAVGSGEPDDPRFTTTIPVKLSTPDGSTTTNTNVTTQKSVTTPIKNRSVQMSSISAKLPTTDSSYTTENDTGTSTDINDSPTQNTTITITTTKPTTTKPTTTPTTPTTTTRDPCADVFNVAPSKVFFPSAHLQSYKMRVRLSMDDATIPVQYNLSVYHDGNMVNNQVAEGKIFNVTNLMPCRNYTACVVGLFEGCPESTRICSATTTAANVSRVQIQVFDPEISSSEATFRFNRSETDCTLNYTITVNGTTWQFNGDDFTTISSSAVNWYPSIDCNMIATEFDRNTSAQCKLTGLSPYTRYHVEVQARSASSFTVKASKKFQTKPSSPTPIKNGSATCSENYAKISWEKPDNFNGEFEYYKLDVNICFPNGSNCQRFGNVSLKENYNISNVRRGYKYAFTIRAKTRNVDGFGNKLEIHCETPPLPVEPPGEVLLIIAWVSTFLLMLVLLGFLLVALQKKKIIKLPYVYKWFQSGRSSKDSPGTAIPFRVTSKPVRLVDFEEHYRTMTADSSFKFSQEFEEIISGSPACPTTVAQLNENKPKNRWINILPFDHSRVKLLPIADDVFTDFINASYIPGYRSQREFIASQGPLPNTKDDFWRMVWEQNSPMIVMVTQCIERGKEKCEQYWPVDRETHYYGDLAVKLTSESILTGYSLRIFNLHLKLPMTTSPTEIDLSDLLELIPSSSEIEKGSRTMEVKQMHFTMWPDFGCPENTSLLINFVRSVRNHMPHQSQGPIIVHCSAGVGRTGTFIAVDKLMQHIEDHDFVDIFGTVRDMRNYRTNMVQTEDQYTYIHECVKDLLIEKQTRMPVNGESMVDIIGMAQSDVPIRKRHTESSGFDCDTSDQEMTETAALLSVATGASDLTDTVFSELTDTTSVLSERTISETEPHVDSNNSDVEFACESHKSSLSSASTNRMSHDPSNTLLHSSVDGERLLQTETTQAGDSFDIPLNNLTESRGSTKSDIWYF